MDTKKNVFFTSMSLFLPSVFTYFFWFVVAKVYGAGAVGVTSTIVSIVIILTTLFSFDLQIGMKRLLSKYYREENKDEYSNILISTMIFLSISSLLISILLVYPANLLNIIGIGLENYWVIIGALFLFSYSNLFAESFISTMSSNKYFIYLMIGSMLRFPTLFLFYYFARDADPAPVVSYYISYATFAILSFVYFLKRIKSSFSISIFLNTIKSLIKISVSSWIPNVINVCGIWLGVIIVFALDGSSAGGQFYIAVGIFAVVLFIVSGISKVIHGVIQTVNNNNRMKYLSYSIKIALILTIPISTSILFYSSEFLGILGVQFEASKYNLSILMASMPFVIIAEIVYYYLYGLRFHKKVLLLGLIGNVPRVFFYFLITYLYDSNFAAIGYFVGSVLQSFFSTSLPNPAIWIENKLEKVLICVIPICVAIPLWLIQVNYILASLIIVLISFILYLRFGQLNHEDITKLLHAMLSPKLAETLSRFFGNIISIIRR